MFPQSEPLIHEPVLLEQVVEWLQPASEKVVVDCTVGTGGHSLGLLPQLMPRGRLIAIDHDAEALARAQQRLIEFTPHLEFVHDNFSRLPEILAGLGLSCVDGLVADLGVSSLHLGQAERGFSFASEGPLDMRMDQRLETTAASLVRQLPEYELARIFYVYGQERWSRRIAKRIVEARRIQPLTTTTQLAQIVAEAVPGRGPRRIHPATRTFQALRIAVNGELNALEALLQALPECLKPGARAVIISFHSLEDRLVKQAFRQGAQAGRFRLLTKKPLVASDEEMARNPKSRSAKLRAVERV